MDTFELHENFITRREQLMLIRWSMSVRGVLSDRKNLRTRRGGRRLSGSVAGFTPIDFISDLPDRFEEALGLVDRDGESTVERLKYKLVIHETGADTQNHVDVYSNRYPNFFRAALLVQAADRGGIFQVNNVPINFPELSLLSFTGASSHGVTTVAQGERILLRANWFRP